MISSIGRSSRGGISGAAAARSIQPFWTSGGVLDQSADRQRADRRRRSRLLIGQAVGHREERVLVEPQELDQSSVARRLRVGAFLASLLFLRGGVDVKISDTGDFGAVVDDLPVDVQHQGGHRIVGVRTFRRPARPPQVIFGQPAHAVDPMFGTARRADATPSPRPWRRARSRSSLPARRSGCGCASRRRR